jgi:hypothetical protein
MPTIKPQVYTVEDAEDSGVIGTILDPIENEAYTVQGAGRGDGRARASGQARPARPRRGRERRRRLDVQGQEVEPLVERLVERLLDVE